MAICSGIFKSLGDCLVLTMLRVRSGQGRNVDFFLRFLMGFNGHQIHSCRGNKGIHEDGVCSYSPSFVRPVSFWYLSAHAFFFRDEALVPTFVSSSLGPFTDLHRFASFCIVCLVVESFRLSSSHCVMRWTLASRTGPMTISLCKGCRPCRRPRKNRQGSQANWYKNSSVLRTLRLSTYILVKHYWKGIPKVIGINEEKITIFNGKSWQKSTKSTSRHQNRKARKDEQVTESHQKTL